MKWREEKKYLLDSEQVPEEERLMTRMHDLTREGGEEGEERNRYPQEGQAATS